MLKFVVKKNCDPKTLETGDYALGYKEIIFLANIGTFPGGGYCLVVKADGQNTTVNSNDLIHDLDAYDIVDE